MLKLLIILFLISEVSAQGLHFNVANPATARRINMSVIESSDFISRHYAFNGSFKVYRTEIMFKSRDNNFYSALKEKADAVSAIHNVFSKGTKNYIAIFVLFADSTIKYYVYEQSNLKYSYVIKLGNEKFKVYPDSKMEFVKFDTENMEYTLKVFSVSENTFKLYTSDILIDEE